MRDYYIPPASGADVLSKIPAKDWQLPVSPVASDCGMLMAGRFLSPAAFMDPTSDSFTTNKFSVYWGSVDPEKLRALVTDEVKQVVLSKLRAQNKSVVVATLRQDTQTGPIAILEALGFQKVTQYAGQYKKEPYMGLYVLTLRGDA